MDLSALIFVALAVAWGAYLLPLALKHHESSSRSRGVEGFSQRMRVLARREPADKRTARLVRPGQPAGEAESSPAPAPAPAAAAAPAPELTPAQLRARRAAAKRATKRRRNVLALLLVAAAAVVGVAAFAVISWGYVAIPVALLAAWLVACRVMVKGERRGLVPAARMPADRPVEQEQPAPTTVAPTAAAAEEGEPEIDPMEDTSAGISAVSDPALWDPVPVTLPTYVSKPAAARRTVRTIELDDTGVWTSGRTDADAQLAREADEAQKAEKARQSRDDGRAFGS
ncbi:divisome protein SepX/GlpR [Nocardioides mangrovi]|uniref:Uncharacterized protein n=1 Tax=Nocardioides mangrovi TaxID=2874580 RepID=A0ABS7U9V7_9ACTN|nr:hypothetical protein [Nocardioides mangrovi]MBZ5737769.1 hypothetical protein [Nocardioides mangrovi]